MNIVMMEIKEVVRLIVKAADGIKMKQRRSSLEFGELLGYATCLSVIRDEFLSEKDKKMVGIDFDPDVRYLGMKPQEYEKEPDEEDEELCDTETAMAIVKDIVVLVTEYADENMNRTNPDDVAIGEVLGYAACLRIIREVFYEDRKKIGLDFNPDDRYMNIRVKR